MSGENFVMRRGNRFAATAFINVAQLFTSHSRRSSSFDLRCGEGLIRSAAQCWRDPDDPQGRKHMNVTRLLGLTAVGALLVLAAPTERAQAVSLSSPGAAAVTVQDGSQNVTTEVRWHHRGHRHWRRHWHHGHRRW
jgi:hypothetical protein